MRFAGVSSVRRIVVRLTIGSFAIAALMGITALLVPGRFGSVQGRILMTTLVFGVTSVLMLCYLAIGETRNRWLGVVGGVAAVTSAMCALDMFWAHWQHDPGPGLLRTFGVSGIVALNLAQFSLLLAVIRRGGHGRVPTALDNGGRHCPRRAPDRRCPRLESGGRSGSPDGRHRYPRRARHRRYDRTRGVRPRPPPPCHSSTEGGVARAVGDATACPRRRIGAGPSRTRGRGRHTLCRVCGHLSGDTWLNPTLCH